MTTVAAPRQHLFLPWTIQEREDPVLEFDRAEGVYFFDRQGRRYLDFLSQLFHCNLGHGNRRVIEAIQRQAERACCVSPQVLTAERSALAHPAPPHPGPAPAGAPRRSALEPGPPSTARFFDPFGYRCDFGLQYPSC